MPLVRAWVGMAGATQRRSINEANEKPVLRYIFSCPVLLKACHIKYDIASSNRIKAYTLTELINSYYPKPKGCFCQVNAD